jgi:hypothetical protein
MQLAHKIRLNPTNKQVTHFKKACGGKNIDESKSYLRALKLTKDNYRASKLLKGIEVQWQIFPQESKFSDHVEMVYMPGDF